MEGGVRVSFGCGKGREWSVLLVGVGSLFGCCGISTGVADSGHGRLNNVSTIRQAKEVHGYNSSASKRQGRQSRGIHFAIS